MGFFMSGTMSRDGKVNKISPTQFEMIKTKFVPKQNLDIIFVHLP